MSKFTHCSLRKTIAVTRVKGPRKATTARCHATLESPTVRSTF